MRSARLFLILEMKKKLRLYQLIIIFIISGKLFGQCPTDASLFELVSKSKTLQPDKLIPKLEKLLKDVESCKDLKDSTIGNIYYNLSNTCFLKKDEKKTLYYGKMALKYWESYVKLKPRGLTYAAYIVAAYNHIFLNYIEAIKYYKLTIEYSADNYWKSYCLKLISDLELELGDFESMLNSLQKAQTYAELSNQNQSIYLMSEIYNCKGMAYYRSGFDKKAIENLKLAQSFHQRYYKATNIEEGELIGNIFLNMGVSYSNLKNFRASLENYKNAEKTFAQSNLTRLLHNVYGNLGLLYSSINQYEEANNMYIKAVKSFGNQKNSVELSRIYLNYSNSLKAENKLDSAIKTIETAVQVFPLLDMKKQNFAIIRSKRTLFYIFRDYGKFLLAAYEKNKDRARLNKSLEYFSYADNLLNLMRQEHQGQQSKSFWREHSRSFYESAIEACRLAKDAKKAFYFFEQSRAMLLLDDLKENNARELLSEQEKIKEKTFQSQIFELQMQIENKPEQSAAYKQITQRLLSAKDLFAEFKKGLEKKYPAYYSAKYGNNFKDLNTLRHWLKDNQYNAFVTYFIGDSATYAMKIMPSAIKFIKLPRDRQNLSSRFINFCADADTLNKHFPAFLALSNQLYKRLIQSLEVTEGRVIISYDDNFLPFEALSSSSKKEDFLVRHCAISYAYSANFLLESIEAKNQYSNWLSKPTFLGVAPVNFDKSLSVYDLPLSANSLKNIDDIFDGKLLLKNDASKQAFMEQFPKHRLVQLYTHADTTNKGPVFYLHNAPVYVSEIRRTQAMHTEMIVLSACKTALGKNVKGEGVFSLARSFSALGIPSLITTLWNVDEKATYEITELFYQNLSEGLPKDLALQKAKQTFINANNRNILPTLWAPSILIGDATPVEQPDLWLIGIISILIIGIGIFIYFRYRTSTLFRFLIKT